MKDITIVEKDKDKWVIRVNTFARPYGLSIPLSSNKDIKIEPGVTYDKDGRMITNKDDKPLLVPAKIYIPGDFTYEQVLDVISEIKKKEENCPICQTIKSEVRKGNVTPAGEDATPILTPEEAERLLKKKMAQDKNIDMDKPDTDVGSRQIKQPPVDVKSKFGDDNADNTPQPTRPKKRTPRKKKEMNSNDAPKQKTEESPLIKRFPLLEEIRPKRWFR